MLDLLRTAKVDAVCASFVLVAVLLAVGGLQTAHSTEPAIPSQDTPDLSTASPREGAVLQNQAGQFQRQGGRLVFVTTDGQRFTALENLNLQRVADKLELDNAAFTWLVSGTVTEYRGDRFLLISRAQARRLSDAQASLTGSAETLR